MVIIKQLYDLQELDLGLDGRREALSRVASQLGETQQLLDARAALQEAEKKLRGLEAEQRDRELEAETLRAKVKAADSKLYGGTTRNSKELQSMQADAQALKKQQRVIEDQALDLMVQVESSQAERNARKRELDATEQEWRREQERLRGEKARLEAETAQEETRRQRLTREVDGAVLRRYEDLRPALQGRAVVKVERGMCLGCRIDLPQSVLQQVRLPQAMVLCHNCGRILYGG